MSEQWSAEFEAFDEHWTADNYHLRATEGGVRKTFYAAGYRAGSNDVNADLLAACEAAVAAIQHNADSGWSDCDCDGDCEAAFALWSEAESLLKAAIAQAMGEASGE